MSHRKQPMTSRERVLTALACEEPDRVPINYHANPGIDRRLKEHYSLGPDEGEKLARALGVDFRGVGTPYTGPPLHTEPPNRHVDIWGIHTRWIEHDSGGYWDFCDFPLMNATEEQIAEWPMPDPDDFDYSVIPERCRECGDYAVVAGGAGTGDIINSAGMIRGMEQVLVDLMTDDPAGLLYIDRRADILIEVTRRTIEAAKGRVNLMWMGEDLGTQHTPLMSLELYRKHIKPRHKRFVDMAKSFDLPIIMHTCGSSSWAYEDFIEIGIDGVDTLQPEAANMSPRYLKDHFGGRLAFHGCISTAGPVAYGTPDEVVANVRETLDIMMPCGGYMLAPTHSLQDNSPTENVVAMYDAAKKYGQYL